MGLQVSGVTETSITWTWTAVEGALGYQVQVSMDQMFDDSDMTAPTAETTYTVPDLEPQTSVSLRVRAAGGSLEEPLLSAWSPHFTGTSDMPIPTPPLPTPTGLTHEVGMGSITWTWNAVEGADGYDIQVRMDEMFSDMDEPMSTTETHYTVEDLGYSATRYARVRSTSGEGDDKMISQWTTHVTAMTDPEPVTPPDPVSVMFSLPDDESEMMVADNDDDEASAKASVNDKIIVQSNSSAVITPMFVEDANGVSVAEGSNEPFSLVDWSMLQSDVLSDGATFMVQRTTIGASQEMEPSGDVAYITCGPFECQPGMEPPEITTENSAACNAFDPDLILQVGKIDNDVVESSADSGDIKNDGLDIGWVTSQKGAMTVTHHFSGVAKGKNYKVTGRDSVSGTDKALPMDLGDGDPNAAGADDPDKNADTTNADYGDALMVSAGGATSACLDYKARETRGGLDKPDNCFRIIGDPDYLSGYTVELAAKDAGVTWGNVNWEDDPFEDLECPSVTFDAAEQVDICSLFEDEVDQATEEGWKNLTWVVAPGGGTDGTNTVLGELRVEVKNGATSERFTTLWFDHDLDGKIKKDPMHDLYDQNDPDPDDNTPGNNRVGGADQANQTYIEISLLDKDLDPAIGDFGKIDILNADADAGEESDFDPDGKADNFAGQTYEDVRECTEDDGGDDADNTICDAKRDWPVEVMFASGTFDCSTKRSFTISCSWDASGEMKQSRRDGDQPAAVVLNPAAGGNLDEFLKCEVK